MGIYTFVNDRTFEVRKGAKTCHGREKTSFDCANHTDRDFWYISMDPGVSLFGRPVNVGRPADFQHPTAWPSRYGLYAPGGCIQLRLQSRFPKSSWRFPGIWVSIPAFFAVALFSGDFGFGLVRCGVILLYCGIPLSFAFLASYGVMRLALLLKARFQRRD